MAFSRVLTQLFLWCFVAAASAYTTFDPTCTRPDSPVNYVSGSDTRSTLEILWGSLFTIVACTWTIHHPNVPEQRNGRFPGWIGNLRWQLGGAVESFKLALVTIFAPELIVGIAINQRNIAHKNRRDLASFASQDGVPWTITHAYYAAMGGFVLRTTPTDGGQPTMYHLMASDVVFLRKAGHLAQLPNISAEELTDRSKTDPVLKSIALCQILWSIAQVSVRVIHRLPVSLLELNVLAFAACAIVIYSLNWDKPKHITLATVLLEYPGSIPVDIEANLEGSGISIVSATLLQYLSEDLISHPPKGLPLSNTTSWRIAGNDSGNHELLEIGCLFLTTMVFGGIHLAGWNVAFPTAAEQLVWRIASTYMTATPLAIVTAMFAAALTDSDAVMRVCEVLQNLLCWLYVLTRLFILVETFRTFLHLPVGAFVSTWTTGFPHFS